MDNHVLALAVVHTAAGLRVLIGRSWHPRLLSLAAGVSTAYVFVGVLPDLGRGDKRALAGGRCRAVLDLQDRS